MKPRETVSSDVLAARATCKSSTKPVDCLLRIANGSDPPDMAVCQEAQAQAGCIHDPNIADLCAGISTDKKGHCQLVYD